MTDHRTPCHRRDLAVLVLVLMCSTCPLGAPRGLGAAAAAAPFAESTQDAPTVPPDEAADGQVAAEYRSRGMEASTPLEERGLLEESWGVEGSGRLEESRQVADELYHGPPSPHDPYTLLQPPPPAAPHSGPSGGEASAVRGVLALLPGCGGLGRVHEDVLFNMQTRRFEELIFLAWMSGRALVPATSLCVCACVRACERECVHVFVCERTRTGVRAFVCAHAREHIIGWDISVAIWPGGESGDETGR